MKKTVFVTVLTLLLVSMLTLAFDIEPVISTTKFTQPATAYSTSSYENVTTHEGDLIINGTQTYVIENVTFFIKGDLIVKDDAKLMIRNAHVIVNTTYKNEFWVYVRNRADLEVENSILNETCLLKGFYGGEIIGELMLMVEDDANLTMRNSHSYWRIGGDSGSITIDSSTVAEVYLISASFDIADSRILAIALYFRGDDQDAELDGFEQNQRIPSLYFESGRKVLRLENTEVLVWNVNLECEYRKGLTIRDSHMSQIWPNFDEPVNVSDIKPGYFENWNIHQHVEGLIPWNLTLVNATLDRWKLIFFSDAYVENAIHVQIDPWNDTTVVVKDSEIDYLDARGSKYLKFTNCVVDNVHFLYLPELENYCGHGNFFVEFENSVVKVESSTSEFCVAVQLCFIKGTVSFQLPLPKVNFQKGVTTREYPLIVNDASGNPFPDASINLFDAMGRLVWNGKTDDEGIVDFNITFTSSNYTDTPKLEVFKEGFYNSTQTVSFLSNTPISISLTQKPLGDINEDHVVNILDIYIVAKAFGSKPGYPNWNPDADLDKNGEISIIDLYEVAKDFGKTT